jgi:hypothetical protein
MAASAFLTILAPSQKYPEGKWSMVKSSQNGQNGHGQEVSSEVL